MEKKNIKKRIKFLIEIIKKANEDYYIKNESNLSDNEFDKYIQELIFLEKKYPEFKKNNSPTQQVGGYVENIFKSYNHRYPLLSLNNAFSKKEIQEFNSRCEKELNQKKLEYIGEFKIDGLSISLIYKKGILKIAATRGDGHTGEVVTSNVMTIEDIPKKLKNAIDIEVRGEVYMDNKNFINLNKERIKKGLLEFRNPRNGAAGSLRQINFKETKKRNLKTFFYEITYLNLKNKEKITKQIDVLNFLKNNNFSVNQNYTIGTIDKMINFCNIIEKKRNSLPYIIDGVVLKLNNINYQYELGTTNKSPRGSIAYKFAPEQKITKIEKINFSIGRTGVITPVAKLKPILIGGSIVSKASLHNEDYIKNKDIRIGDYVVIQKAGDIIPEIANVLKNRRNKNTKPFKFIKVCPICDSKIIKIDGEAKHKCIAKLYCPAQLIKGLLYFVSRDAMNIEGLGEKNITLLVKNKLVSNPVDIYLLKKEQIINLEGFKEKSAQNLINAINKSKNKGFSSLLNGLGIPLVGNKVSKILSRYFRKIDILIKATKQDLLNIKDIGEKVADNIIIFFKEKRNIYIIEELKKLKISTEDKFILKSEKLKEKQIVLTGTFFNYDRKELIKLIENFGGSVITSVSKKTNLVIAGENAGIKLQKAKDLKISILNENEFLKLIEKKE